MNRLAAAALVAVLLAPSVNAASYTQVIKQQGPGTATFNPPDAYNNFTFSLSNPPFVFGDTDANNVFEYYVATTVHKRASTGTGDYSADFAYVIDAHFNGTNSVRAEFQYDRQSAFWPVVRWVGDATIYFNDVPVCRNSWTIGYYNTIGDPHPGFRFSFGLHPESTADEGGDPRPYLKVVDFDDWHSGASRGSTGNSGWYHDTCLHVLTDDEIGGFDPDDTKLAFNDVNELTTQPYITVGTLNQHQTTVVFDYFFLNSTRALTRFNDTLEANACDGFELLGFCISASRMFDWFGEKTKTVFAALTNLLPFGDTLRNVIAVPIVSIISFVQLVFLFFFLSGDGIGTGTVLLSTFLYLATWGCILAVFTGNYLLIVTTPFYVFYGVGYVVVRIFIGTWWLITKAYEAAIQAFHAVAQLVRG